MVIGGGVGTVVEHWVENHKEWWEGYVTSLEPLLVTNRQNGPSGNGLSYDEVRAVSAARQAQLDAMRELAARISVGA
eukprot:COSAG06_NODE_46364_length_347_cov_1.044355_1_plen_76_part_10